MSASKKLYVDMAEQIASRLIGINGGHGLLDQHEINIVDAVISGVCAAFERDSPAFNRTKFEDAVGLNRL